MFVNDDYSKANIIHSRHALKRMLGYTLAVPSCLIIFHQFICSRLKLSSLFSYMTLHYFTDAVLVLMGYNILPSVLRFLKHFSQV